MVRMIRLEKFVSTQGNTGNWTESVTKYNCWAEVTRTGGSKTLSNGNDQMKTSYDFKVRFRPDFKPSGNWRIVYCGIIYTVNSIERVNEDRFFWIFKCDGFGVQR